MTPQEAYLQGRKEALAESLQERNRIARECADAHDALRGEQSQHAATRDLLSIRDDDLKELRDEFERVTGRDWTREQFRRWCS